MESLAYVYSNFNAGGMVDSFNLHYLEIHVLTDHYIEQWEKGGNNFQSPLFGDSRFNHVMVPGTQIAVNGFQSPLFGDSRFNKEMIKGFVCPYCHFQSPLFGDSRFNPANLKPITLCADTFNLHYLEIHVLTVI